MDERPTNAPAASSGGGLWAWATAAVGCTAILAFTVASWWPTPGAEPGPGGTAPAAVVQAFQPVQAPSAQSPTGLEASLPAAPGPVSIAVPEVGIVAAVDAVGTRPDGALAVPDDPTRVGWYSGGARPGSAEGSAVVAGHLDRPGGELGPLAALSRAVPGTEVTVLDAAGVTTTFVVRSLEVLAREQLYLADPFRTTGEPVLTLITCTGPFDRERGVYPANLVVTAVPRG
ncbi:MAG: class F sortase [Sporichthyaceae bacterium]